MSTMVTHYLDCCNESDGNYILMGVIEPSSEGAIFKEWAKILEDGQVHPLLGSRSRKIAIESLNKPPKLFISPKLTGVLMSRELEPKMLRLGIPWHQSLSYHIFYSPG